MSTKTKRYTFSANHEDLKRAQMAAKLMGARSLAELLNARVMELAAQIPEIPGLPEAPRVVNAPRELLTAVHRGHAGLTVSGRPVTPEICGRPECTAVRARLGL